MYTPNTVVHLLGVPLNKNQKQQILFSDRSSQFQYFSEKIKRSFNDFTYQRKDNIIRIPLNADTLFSIGVNYVMYDNIHFSQKWIYAFIEEIEYINDNCTNLHIKTDVFQTWFLNCNILPSYIKRETVINDNIGVHTLPEGLPIGTPKYFDKKIIGESMSAETASTFDKNYYCVVVMSEPIKFLSSHPPKADNFIGGVSNPCYYYACDRADYVNLMDKINENGQASGVIACLAVPKFFAKFHELQVNPNPPHPDPDPPTPTHTNYLASAFNKNFTVLQIYGNSAEYGGWHDGQDLTAGDKAQIFSTVSGTLVHHSFNDGGYGWLSVIQDSAGYYHFYGHMSELSNLTVGQAVPRGTLLGLQGQTGQATVSHLHYEISQGYGTGDWSAGSVNPSEYLKNLYPNENIYPNVRGDY